MSGVTNAGAPSPPICTGSAIYVAGNATLELCNFDGNGDALVTAVRNHAVMGVGGAIYVNSGGAVLVNGSTFTSNTASNGGGGGAIYVEGGSSLRINGSSFTSNTANGGCGGAIDTESGAAVLVTGSIFTSNSDNNHGGGGAICVEAGNCGNGLEGCLPPWYLRVEDSSFSSNEAADGDDAIYFEGNSHTPQEYTNGAANRAQPLKT